MKKILITPVVANFIQVVKDLSIKNYYYGHRHEDADRAEAVSEVHEAAFSGFITPQQFRILIRAAEELGLEV